jgi:hypothetical protein
MAVHLSAAPALQLLSQPRCVRASYEWPPTSGRALTLEAGHGHLSTGRVDAAIQPWQEGKPLAEVGRVRDQMPLP